MNLEACHGGLSVVLSSIQSSCQRIFCMFRQSRNSAWRDDCNAAVSRNCCVCNVFESDYARTAQGRRGRGEGEGARHVPAEIPELYIHIRFEMPRKNIAYWFSCRGTLLLLLFWWWVVTHAAGKCCSHPLPHSLCGFINHLPCCRILYRKWSGWFYWVFLAMLSMWTKKCYWDVCCK